MLFCADLLTVYSDIKNIQITIRHVAERVRFIYSFIHSFI